ncbi:MAG: PKD domain-containing protein [Bacteroidia bacterium]|nr:PKD domain-containing protein [Bacteroidia bacterium]
MKTNYSFLKFRSVCKVFLTLMFFPVMQTQAQLTAGIGYTLDNTTAASATNYTNLQSFFNDISSGTRSDGGPVQGPGVTGSGDIVLNILNSVVNEQIVVLPHPSLNVNRRVVVKGKYPYWYYNPNASSKYVLWLKGADHFVFDSLQIVNWNASWCETVILSNNADSNIFRNCSITNDNYDYNKITVNTSHTADESVDRSNYGDAGAIIVFGNSINSLKHNVRGANGRGNLFENNKIICVLDGNGRRGATYGIFELGDGTANSGGNMFIGNRIVNPTGVGIYSYASGGGKYNYNTILRSTTAAIQDDNDQTCLYGIQLYYPYLSAYPDKDIEVIGNTIRNMGDSSRTNNAKTFYGIAISRSEGITSDAHAGYAGTNVIRVEGNNVYNNYAGNKYDNKAYVYPFAAYLAQNVFLVNNVFANNVAYPSILNPIREARSYIEWQYSTGDVVNNTFYRSFDYSLHSGTVNAYDYLNVSGSKIVAGNPSITRQIQTNFYNNISYYDVKATNSYNNGPGFLYLYDIKNNSFFYDSIRSNNKADINSVNYLRGVNNPLTAISVADLNNLGGADSNIVANPAFVNPNKNNFAYLNPALNGMGNYYTSFAYPHGITKDKSGYDRDSTHPDIGAVEVDFDFKLGGDFNQGDYDVCSSVPAKFQGYVISKFNFDYQSGQIGYVLNNQQPVLIDFDTIHANDTTFFEIDNLNFKGAPDNSRFTVFIAHFDDNHANDTLQFNLNVHRGITNSSIGANITSKGLELDSSRSYWVTIPNDSIVFEVQFASPPPAMVVSTVVLSASGDTLPFASYYQPVNTGFWIINPTDDYIDSMVEARLILHNSLTGCDSVIVRNVLVSPYGRPDFLVKKACVGKEVVFENKSTVKSGKIKYEWNFGDGQTSTAVNPKHTYALPGYYQVTLKTTTDSFGFIKSLTKSVKVSSFPNADFAVSNLCFGLPISIQNNTTSSSDTVLYSWDFGDGNTATDAVPTPVYQDAGNYSIRLIAASEGDCADTIVRPISLYPTPKADFVYTSPACFGSPVGFTNKTTIPFSTWNCEWQFGQGESKSLQTSPNYIFQSVGSKDVKLVAYTNEGCSDSVVKTLEVNLAPQISITHSDACIGLPTIFNSNVVVPSGNTATYKWVIESKTIIDSVPKVTFATIGLKTISLQVIFSSGCANNATIQVGTGHKPNAQFTLNDMVCTKEVLKITNTSTISFGSAKYNWNMGDTVYNDVFVPNHVYKTNASQNYQVMLVAFASTGVCSDTAEQNVRVGVTPVCDFVINPIWIPGHRGYEFEVDDFDATYKWDFGDGEVSSDKNPQHQFKEDGKYDVKLSISTVEGCECVKTVSHTVTNLNVRDGLNAASFKLYPNPTTGFITVKLQNVNDNGIIEVIDMKGARVLSVSHAELTSNGNVLDLTNQQAGIYIIRYISGAAIAIGKVELVN